MSEYEHRAPVSGNHQKLIRLGFDRKVNSPNDMVRNMWIKPLYLSIACSGVNPVWALSSDVSSASCSRRWQSALWSLANTKGSKRCSWSIENFPSLALISLAFAGCRKSSASFLTSSRPSVSTIRNSCIIFSSFGEIVPSAWMHEVNDSVELKE